MLYDAHFVPLLTALFAAVAASACGGHSRPADDAAHAPGHEPPHGHAHGHGHGHAPGPGQHAHGHDFKDASGWAAVFDDPARDASQRPDDVIRAMALTPSMTVADIGAGTGYFSMRLARAVPSGKVIATDIEPNMVRYLTERAQREHLGNVQALQSGARSSGLAPSSVDRILVVHVWHHIEDRVAYARDLSAALRPGGKVFVVEFSMTAKEGPPVHMRLAPEKLIGELTAAGLSAKAASVELPDQYVIEASR